MAQRVTNKFASTLDESVRENYEQKYSRERQNRAPSEIHEIFERQRRSIETGFRTQFSDWSS